LHRKVSIFLRNDSDCKDVDLHNTRKRYAVIESSDLMRNISWLASCFSKIKKPNKHCSENQSCKSNVLDGDKKSPHNDMIGEYVTTADMVKDKESAVKKRKRGQAKGGVMSTDKGGEGTATKEGKDGEVTEKGDKTSMIRRSNRCNKKV
jgi:hypothetical protein